MLITCLTYEIAVAQMHFQNKIYSFWNHVYVYIWTLSNKEANQTEQLQPALVFQELLRATSYKVRQIGLRVSFEVCLLSCHLSIPACKAWLGGMRVGPGCDSHRSSGARCLNDVLHTPFCNVHAPLGQWMSDGFFLKGHPFIESLLFKVFPQDRLEMCSRSSTNGYPAAFWKRGVILSKSCTTALNK